MNFLIFFFFFSSRRRHTRWNCDWSSDVCSSDLFDSLTVGENMGFPLEGQPGMTDEDVEEYVIKIAQMLEVDDVLDKLPSELSTGMKRAVAIGRALAQNPEAIL